MAVSSGDPRASILVAQKTDEDFYSVLFLLIGEVNRRQREVKRLTVCEFSDAKATATINRNLINNLILGTKQHK